MRGKKAGLHKTLLKERNKPTPPPPPSQPVKKTTPTPEASPSIFTTLTQTIGQGMAFGAGSSMGHRLIDGVSGLWGGKEDSAKQDSPKTTTFNECDDFKREFMDCLQKNVYCNEVQSQYLRCLDNQKQ